MPIFLDAHAHFFTAAHLDAGEFPEGTKPTPYTLREHLDGLLSAAPSDAEVVCVNIAYSTLPTSQNVLDSFDELSRLQTLYGARYSRVKCVLGTCRADEPKAAELIAANPLMIGARVFLKDVKAAAAKGKIQALAAVTDALASTGKYLEIFGTDCDTILAAVNATPAGVSLMVDHLGAWATPAMEKYEALLAALAARTSPVLIKGPGHRTSFSAPVTAQYVAAAVRAVGAGAVLLSATDAPHVFTSPADFATFAQRGFVAGALDLSERVCEHVRHALPTEPNAGGSRAAEDLVLKFCPTGLAPSPSGMIHARRPAWYVGEDLTIPVRAHAPPAGGAVFGEGTFGWTDGEALETMHSVLFRPVSAGSTAVASSTLEASSKGGLVVIVGSGYTGFLGLYPALLSQELTNRGITTIALEYPCYGACTGRGAHEISIAAQARAWAAAAEYARNVLGFTKVVGASWAMGSPALAQAALIPPSGSSSSSSSSSSAAASSASPVLFDGIAILNALMDADAVHTHVIASVNDKRKELTARIDGIPGLAGDVALPAPTLAEFRKHVSGMEDGALYAGFAGYPLDAKTLEVVINQLYSHEGYAVPQVRGAFWKELASLKFGQTKLPPATRALVVHGEANELHTPTNVVEFVETNKAQVEGGATVLLPGGKHNDFMNFGSPNFDEMIRHIAKFALSTAASSGAEAGAAAEESPKKKRKGGR